MYNATNAARSGQESIRELRHRYHHRARFDVSILIETVSVAAAQALHNEAAFEELARRVQDAASYVHIITASNAKRIGAVDHNRDGVFLFNYFYADDTEQNLAVWEYTAGWFEKETNLDNSTLLLPSNDAESEYTIVNHCRWDHLRDILPSLLFKPSFRSYVLGNFAANNTAASPILYRLACGHCSRDTRLSHEKLVSAGFTVLTPSRPGYDGTPAAVGRTAQAAADALAALLDALTIPTVSVIGISAAGPTALAFAQRHSARTRSVILESAVTTAWDSTLKRQARILFGRAEKLTWATVKLALRLMPTTLTKTMLQAMTTFKASDVLHRMNQTDLRFVQQMIDSMQSGMGFMQDIEHHVEQLHTIQAPVLVMYSPHDKSVPPRNAQRIAREVPQYELYEVLADSHLIWIGPTSEQVWRKRLAFLQATQHVSNSSIP